jgi:hypothetical protein
VQAMAKGKPLLAAIERRIETVPVTSGVCS